MIARMMRRVGLTVVAAAAVLAAVYSWTWTTPILKAARAQGWSQVRGRVTGGRFEPHFWSRRQAQGIETIDFSYSVAGTPYEVRGEPILMDRGTATNPPPFVNGQEVDVWYDPANPSRATVFRAMTWTHQSIAAMLLVSWSILVIAGVWSGVRWVRRANEGS